MSLSASTRSVALTPKQRFVNAAFRRPVDRPPFWVMRQAGRYLPEYQEVRKSGSFLELVRDPVRAAELTCQPIRRFGMDAAVIFSDILVPVAAMGLKVEFLEGEGPKIAPPLEGAADLKRLSDFDPELDTGFLADAIRLVRKELGPDRAIIGFSGAPFTTASYMIEGGSTKEFAKTKSWLYGDRSSFTELLEHIVDCLVPYLGLQVEAGADALQIFDSWGGQLDARTWRDVLFPPMERLICAVKALGVPVILYVNGCAHLLEVLADLGPTVIGLDWRVDPEEARRRVGDRVALQGNLDPTALFAPPERVRAMVADVVRAFGPAPGYIFNLGSGILPKTPLASMDALAATLREPRSA